MNAPVGWRLGVTGKEQAERAFREVGEAGAQSAEKFTRAYQKAGVDVEAAQVKAKAAGERLAKASEADAARLEQAYDRALANVDAAVARRERAWQQEGAAAPTAMQQRIMALSGSNTRYGTATAPDRGGRGVDRPSLSVRASAEFFTEQESAARRLLAAIDPLHTAQERYNRELAEARMLAQTGAITDQQFAMAKQHLKRELDQSTAAMGRNAEMSGQARMGYRVLQYQAADVATQIAMGTNLFLIFAQQMPDVLFAWTQITEGAAASAQATGAAAEATDLSRKAKVADTAATGANTAATGANTVAVGANTVAETANTGATAAAMTAKQRFAAFMTGGYGAALMVGITLIGVLASKLLTSSGASREAEESAKKHETAAQTLARALRGEADAVDKLRDAIRAQNEQARQAIETDYERARASEAAARSSLQAANAVRARMLAELEKASLLDEHAWAASSPGNPLMGWFLGAEAEDRAEALRVRIAEQNRAIAENRETLTNLGVAEMQNQVEASMDAATAAIDRQRRAVADLNREYRMGTFGVPRTPMAEAEYRRRYREIEQRREREEEAARRAGRGGAGGAGGERLLRSPDEVIRGLGGRVTSAARTPEYNRSVGGEAGSYHLTTNGARARDVGLLPGDHRENRLRLEQALRSEGYDIRESLGPDNDPRRHDDHYHFAWSNQMRGGRGVGRSGPQGRSEEENRIENVRRQDETMRRGAQSALAYARALLEGGTAASQAAAQRAAATDATLQGTEAEERGRLQLQLNVAESAVQGAQMVARLRDETSARAALNDRIAAGSLDAGRMNAQLEEEAALRPLLAMQAVAEGEELQLLTRVIDEYRRTRSAANREDARTTLLTEAATASARIRDLDRLIRFEGSDEEYEIEVARIEAQREAAERGINDPDQRWELEQARLGPRRKELELERSNRARQMLADQADQIELAERELSLVRAGENHRERTLALLEYQIDLERQIDLESEKGRQLLANWLRLDGINERIREQGEAWSELRDIGESFIDTVLNPGNWDDWGEMGRRIIDDLIADFVRLAAVNPLKNWLFDAGLPTLASLGGLLGGGGGGGAGLRGLAGSVGGNAAGTHHWRGGLTWLAENGPEIVSLPAGSKVTPASETRRLLAANDRGIGSIHMPITINAPGADAAQLRRVEEEVRVLRDELPARALAAFGDARSRGFVR